MARPRNDPPAPMSLDALRDIQTRRRLDADVEALLWEIKRLRDVMREVDNTRRVIDRAWLEEVGSHFVALHHLRGLLVREIG